MTTRNIHLPALSVLVTENEGEAYVLIAVELEGKEVFRTTAPWPTARDRARVFIDALSSQAKELSAELYQME